MDVFHFGTFKLLANKHLYANVASEKKATAGVGARLRWTSSGVIRGGWHLEDYQHSGRGATVVREREMGSSAAVELTAKALLCTHRVTISGRFIITPCKIRS